MISFVSTKKMERNAKKKKKLAALANIVQLNSQDVVDKAEEANAKPDIQTDKSKQNTNQIDEDGFIKVTYKKHHEEPERKRAKFVETTGVKESACSGNDDVKQNGQLPTMVTLSDEEYKELKNQLRERTRQLSTRATLRLRDLGAKALIDNPQDSRIPIFLTDIQHLLMNALIGSESPCTPDRWCFLEKSSALSHVVVLLLEGCSLYHYLANLSKFEQTNKIFDEIKLEMVLPPCKPNMMIEEIAQVPLTNVQANNLIKKHGSLEAAIDLNKDPTLLVQSIFPIEPINSDHCDDIHPDDKFPRTKLLLSALQMVDEGYPMPIHGELKTRWDSFVFTKQKYEQVTNRSPIFGVDCEMCRTSAGCCELTRISIVNEQLETVYETLVRPYNEITDYLTQYSGITPEIMKQVTKTLREVQTDVTNLLPADAILVGQSLNSDLMAMRMMHPYVIDTSICYNISGKRKHKTKLQTLAMEFLKESIQKNEKGHDSVEDSLATMKLVKLKLANSIEFGDVILQKRRRIKEIMRAAETNVIQNNLYAHAARRDRRTAIITATPLDGKVKSIIEMAQNSGDEPNGHNNHKSVALFQCDSNKEAVRIAREKAMENALMIANLRVEPEQLHDHNSTATIQKLDKYISNLWKAIAHNGMFVVLMGGAAECPKGLAKIAIKQNVADVIKETPLSI